MKKYRIVGKTNGWIASRDINFNGRCEIILADQLELKQAYKKLLDMYNNDNYDYPSAPNWGVAVRQNRGACATFSDGTRRYESDGRTYEIRVLPDRISDLLEEEVSSSVQVELYAYTGNTHSIHTDYIVSLDDELNFKDLYCESIDDFDFELMDEGTYNSTVLSNSSEIADFAELYGDRNVKVLVIVLKNICNND